MSQHSMSEDAIVTASRLTWAGVVPFIATAIVGAIGFYQAQFLSVFLIYSAVILSFMGGIHFGLVMAGKLERPQGSLINSMLPPLAAWAAYAFWPPLWTLGLLSLMYLFWLNYDLSRVSDKWYQNLRRPVTFVVVGSHFLWFITVASEMRVGTVS
ncbi:DUF3429 domain-containing protein [Aliidiomarina indica]|uniref:DUF3429 domain-containing protein n=1 Tax=Aliidiomarina indica TaxID=2749147 RepID=UPI00188E1061|nr:DUF3429 domain-containing protein [Aliidiomarina indica]